MAWLVSTHSSGSPKPPETFPNLAHPRTPRRSRLLSWGFCLLVLIAIASWPQIKRTSAPFTSNQKLPITGRPWPLSRPASIFEKGLPSQPTEHVYRPDGLLEVNPEGRHPILELIETSETKWESMLDRQSKTLKQAVKEYKRRYKRLPPKGFDIWWEFVQSHNVKLVDEYDTIHTNIQPFWGIAPPSLRETQATWESHPDTFTLGKLPGASKVELLNHTIKNKNWLGRIDGQLEILADVQEHFPEFRATFSVHDGPEQLVNWGVRRQAEEAAERGEYIDVESVAAAATGHGWAAACPPDTPIHSYTPPSIPSSPLADNTDSQHYALTSSKPKSFIYNHHLSMSPCLHPTHLTLSGYLSQFRRPQQLGPDPKNVLVPTFGICVSPLHSDILTITPEQYSSEVGVDPAWAAKVDDRLLWRGSNTGVFHSEKNEWNSSHRIRLVEMGTRRGGEMRVLLPPRPGAGGSGDGDTYGDEGDWDDATVGLGESVRTSALNAAFMDVAFVGKPIQCQEAVCKALERAFDWHKFQPWRDAWMYKYIMDIDGNGWSARFKRLMTSNSLILKSTIFPEWYTERIMPWVHYIPVQVDLTDLYDILAFFRGDLSGAGAHDHLAERIATAGKKWSQELYRREDMTAYHFRLLLEYARVMSLDREAMSYKEGDDNQDEVEL